jgi:hypothetical protein
MEVTLEGHKIVIKLSVFNAGILCAMLDIAKKAVVDQTALPVPTDRILVDLNVAIKKVCSI